MALSSLNNSRATTRVHARIDTYIIKSSNKQTHAYTQLRHTIRNQRLHSGSSRGIGGFSQSLEFIENGVKIIAVRYTQRERNAGYGSTFSQWITSIRSISWLYKGRIKYVASSSENNCIDNAKSSRGMSIASPGMKQMTWRGIVRRTQTIGGCVDTNTRRVSTHSHR